eukprot:comp19521_c1_seq1/m.22833 comp19521_c1_seq1/g.22833  ORF comp19521_c1_seq1/g.22833 comp19521_c1_seq1/m.22833 type:complete len:407 (-) comp19521_c1_seq1:242-1462(-)
MKEVLRIQHFSRRLPVFAQNFSVSSSSLGNPYSGVSFVVVSGPALFCRHLCASSSNLSRSASSLGFCLFCRLLFFASSLLILLLRHYWVSNRLLLLESFRWPASVIFLSHFWLPLFLRHLCAYVVSVIFRFLVGWKFLRYGCNLLRHFWASSFFVVVFLLLLLPSGVHRIHRPSSFCVISGPLLWYLRLLRHRRFFIISGPRLLSFSSSFVASFASSSFMGVCCFVALSSFWESCRINVRHVYYGNLLHRRFFVISGCLPRVSVFYFFIRLWFSPNQHSPRVLWGVYFIVASFASSSFLGVTLVVRVSSSFVCVSSCVCCRVLRLPVFLRIFPVNIRHVTCNMGSVLHRQFFCFFVISGPQLSSLFFSSFIASFASSSFLGVCYFVVFICFFIVWESCRINIRRVY